MPSFFTPFRRVADELAKAARGAGLDPKGFRDVGQLIDRSFEELSSQRSGFAPAGYYIGPKHTARSTNALVLDTVRVCPIVFPRRMELDLVAAECTALNASSVLRVGLYAAHPETRLPDGAPLFDTTISGAATGNRTASISVVVNPTMYWIAATQQGGSATWRTIQGALTDVVTQAPSFISTLLVSALPIQGAPHTGALPTNPVIDTVSTPSAQFPAVAFRRSTTIVPNLRTSG